MPQTRKPTALRRVEGDRSHRRGNTREPQPRIVVDVPACPDGLDAIARQEWGRIAPELHRLGLLTVMDLPMLEQWCAALHVAKNAYAEWRADAFAVKVRAKNGAFTRHPSIGALESAQERMLSISRRFGFTPSDRAGIQGPEVTDAEVESLFTPVRVGR
jgi:P27 family predicted phage terminase small subunit